MLSICLSVIDEDLCHRVCFEFECLLSLSLCTCDAGSSVEKEMAFETFSDQ